VATPVFTWAPSLEVVGTTTFAVRTAQFSDGYSQAVADGINNRSDSWPLTFVGDTAKATAIKAFLDALQGYQSFLWSPPLRAQGLFRCSSYTYQPHGAGVYTITAIFQEVFQA